ncbi:hypothetical protein Pcinc_007452 [Petrolisthes cinctipes]|uniref:Sulfhydryl oxidase n=1 Tax=Petrolisthes cinctipes TaxID=88211 RepID=A0AAE1G8G0_PETCI|nr:hypothetical protein Pcinc_007452 [Petrolisthes cinctipes]
MTTTNKGSLDDVTNEDLHKISPKPTPPGEKPCRACTDFRSWISSQNKASKPSRPGKIYDEEVAAKDVFSSIGKLGPSQETGKSNVGSGNSQTTETTDEDDIPLWGNAKKYGCPADSLGLGRGSWRLLHSMAAYYPPTPSTQEQQEMSEFIKLFANFYPCKPCADDFKEWLQKYPPKVKSQDSLSWWFCDAHNEVNRKLGKPLFDCRLVNQRWRDGWADGSCD